MKERTARTKLCPFFGPAMLIASSCATKSLTPERAKDMGNMTLCQTTACMAWKVYKHTADEGCCKLLGEPS